MKVRIPTKYISNDALRDNVIRIGYCTEIRPTKTSKSFWQIDDMTPAQLDTWIVSRKGDYHGVKIDRRNYERFPFLETF